jgi:hypothetical protein
MKALRYVLFASLLLSLPTLTFAQAHEHGAPDNAATADPVQTDKAAPKAPPTEAQRSFTEMKTLAGQWRGHVTLDPPMKGMGDADLDVTMRVASRGNSIVHELQAADTPFDPAKYDHPITMMYLDEDRLLLTHYCDAGNRPRMTGKLLPDGKTVEFSFLDVAGPLKHGHMNNAKFTVIDENHHIEDWWYLMPGDKLMHAHMVLERKPGSTVATVGK